MARGRPSRAAPVARRRLSRAAMERPAAWRTVAALPGHPSGVVGGRNPGRGDTGGQRLRAGLLSTRTGSGICSTAGVAGPVWSGPADVRVLEPVMMGEEEHHASKAPSKLDITVDDYLVLPCSGSKTG